MNWKLKECMDESLSRSDDVGQGICLEMTLASTSKGNKWERLIVWIKIQTKGKRSRYTV